MPIDFAHRGIMPTEAMQLVMDGASHETVVLPKGLTRDEVREWIKGAPDVIAFYLGEDDDHKSVGYNDTARRAAKHVLAHYEAHPGDRFVIEPVLWSLCAEAVDSDDNASISTFQWGWAINAARYVLGWDPMPNPAFQPIEKGVIGILVMTRAELASYT